MKVFSNFKELIDYIPNCIICGKQLDLHLNGRIEQKSLITNKWNTINHIHFRLKLKDGYLVGKHKEHSFTINTLDNHIISGKDTVSALLRAHPTVNKKCYTCHFVITTESPSITVANYMISNYKNFPPLTLKSEEIYFTRKREKPVSINQIYFEDAITQTRIIVGHKPVRSVYIDFNKIKDLNHLNSKLSTILTFS